MKFYEAVQTMVDDTPHISMQMANDIAHGEKMPGHNYVGIRCKNWFHGNTKKMLIRTGVDNTSWFGAMVYDPFLKGWLFCGHSFMPFFCEMESEWEFITREDYKEIKQSEHPASNALYHQSSSMSLFKYFHWLWHRRDSEPKVSYQIEIHNKMKKTIKEIVLDLLGDEQREKLKELFPGKDLLECQTREHHQKLIDENRIESFLTSSYE